MIPIAFVLFTMDFIVVVTHHHHKVNDDDIMGFSHIDNNWTVCDIDVVTASHKIRPIVVEMPNNVKWSLFLYYYYYYFIHSLLLFRFVQFCFVLFALVLFANRKWNSWTLKCFTWMAWCASFIRNILWWISSSSYFILCICIVFCWIHNGFVHFAVTLAKHKQWKILQLS